MSLLALAQKAAAYYRRHGFAPTVGRIVERLAVRRRRSRIAARRPDGLATIGLDSIESARARGEFIALEPGEALWQDLDVRPDYLYELEILVRANHAGGALTAVLTTENGRELCRQRVAAGAETVMLLSGKYIPIAANAGRLSVALWNTSKGTTVRVPVASGASAGLPPARRIRARSNEDLSRALAGGRDEGGAGSSALGLRLAGRSSSAFATYHRAPAPGFFDAVLPAVGRIYAAGVATSAGGPIEVVQVGLGQPADFSGSVPGGMTVLLLGLDIGTETARGLVKAAKAGYIPVVGVIGQERGADAGTASAAEDGLRVEQLCEWSDLVCAGNGAAPDLPARFARRVRIVEQGAEPALGAVLAQIGGWLPDYRRLARPKFSIVAVMYGKAAQLPDVMETYFQQSYEGEFEIVFVDDASPDNPEPLIKELFERARASGRYARLPGYRIVRNAQNSGNCVSRNVGIAHATGDIVVVIDADCMVNREFLRRHAQAHSFGDCDVVIGPLNIETEDRPPAGWLRALEADPYLVERWAKPQDPVNRLSFLNCITRNFSIRRDFIEGELFDPAFSYSRDPESGFGWEDVEMGYRLYRRGARMKYVSDAFSVHISHAASVPERDKPARSIRNLRKLIDKHPEFALEAKRWVAGTCAEIRGWFASFDLPPSADLAAVEAAVQRAAGGAAGAARAARPARRKQRILSYRWHVPHQYELYKLGEEFSLLRDLPSPMTQSWDFRQRPLPDNVRFVSMASVRESDFDLAILHFDENVLSPEHTNGVLGPEWGAAFRWFVENTRLPKIAICHGTPQFIGQYTPDYAKPDLLQVIEESRRKLVDYLGDIPVVCNSHQAEREWGFRSSRVIWHGFDPTEFPPATYERGILSPSGPLVTSRPHYRGHFLAREVLADFPREHAPSRLFVPDPSPLYSGNQYAGWKYRNYIDEIRRYSVYFNPTLRSPMPRARGEPMMCGVATVSAANHDVDMFIRNGVNGFYADDPAELREHLLYLVRNPGAARKIGAAGRRTALDVFNCDRYLADWRDMLPQAAGG